MLVQVPFAQPSTSTSLHANENIVWELFGCLPKIVYLCTRNSKECKAGSVAQLDRATAF